MSVEKPTFQRPAPLNLTTTQTSSIFHPKNVSMTPKAKGERITLNPLNKARPPPRISQFGSNNAISSPKNLPQAQAQAQPAQLSQNPQDNQSPADFIFLKRKKVVHFLVAENIVREAKLLQDRKESFNSSFLPLERSSSLHIRTPLLNSPKNTTAANTQTNGFFPEISMTQSLYNDKKSMNTVSEGGTAPEIYDALVLAGDYQSKISKFNPMSPKSLLSQDGTPNNRMAKIVKKHQHRIFGMDHVNLKKVNMLLKAKNETHASAKILPPLLMENNSPQHARKNSENVTMNNHTAPDIKKEFTIFQYNPMSDDFQFTEPDAQEVGNMFKTILNPNTEEDLIPPKPKAKKIRKMKTGFKSQEINISLIKALASGDEPQQPSSALFKAKSDKKKNMVKRTDSLEPFNANTEFKKECIPSGLGFRRAVKPLLESDQQIEILSPRAVPKEKEKGEMPPVNSNEKRFRELDEMCKKFTDQGKIWDSKFKKKSSLLENQSNLLYKRAVYTEGEDFLEDISTNNF